MEEVVGSIPTRSTKFSSICEYSAFQFGVIWCQNTATLSVSNGEVVGDRDQVRCLFNTTGRPLTLTREEVFGPVLIAQPYDDLEEVVREANNTVYGLAAGVWTSNISQALSQ